MATPPVQHHDRKEDRVMVMKTDDVWLRIRVERLVRDGWPQQRIESEVARLVASRPEAAERRLTDRRRLRRGAA
jgi:hypothetical protein